MLHHKKPKIVINCVTIKVTEGYLRTVQVTVWIQYKSQCKTFLRGSMHENRNAKRRK